MLSLALDEGKKFVVATTCEDPAPQHEFNTVCYQANDLQLRLKDDSDDGGDVAESIYSAEQERYALNIAIPPDSDILLKHTQS